MLSPSTSSVSCFYRLFFVENPSSAAGAFQMHKVPVPPNLISKQGSEEGSNNMDFLWGSIHFAMKTAGQKMDFEAGRKNRGQRLL